jgi:beta-phosphoglucomutase
VTERARAVLWDLDGTLVDTEAYHWRAWREILLPEGIDLSRERFLASFGQRNDLILSLWLGPDADPERRQRIGEAKEARVRRLIEAEGLAPLPGAADWLDRLARDGFLQAIASSAPGRNVDTMLRASGLLGRFQAVVAAEDVTAGKPDPEVFLTAAARLGVPPSDCVVVEDAAPGIEAARRAGMRSIGVRGATTGAADLVVVSLLALPGNAFARLLAP